MSFYQLPLVFDPSLDIIVTPSRGLNQRVGDQKAQPQLSVLVCTESQPSTSAAALGTSTARSPYALGELFRKAAAARRPISAEGRGFTFSRCQTPRGIPPTLVTAFVRQPDQARPVTAERGHTFPTTPRWSKPDDYRCQTMLPKIRLSQAGRKEFLASRGSDGRVLSTAEAREQSRIAREERIKQKTERLEADARARVLSQRREQWLSACAAICFSQRLIRQVLWYRKRWLYVLIVVRIQRYLRRLRVHSALRRISPVTKIVLVTCLRRYLYWVRKRLHQRSSRVVAAFLREAARLTFFTRHTIEYLVCVRRIQAWYRRVMCRDALNFAFEHRRLRARLHAKFQGKTTTIGRMLYKYDALEDSIQSEFARELLLRLRERRLTRWKELRCACRLTRSMKVSDEAFMFLGQGRPYEDGRRGVLTPSRWAAIASYGWSTADDATLKEWKEVVRALVGRVLNDTPLLRRSMGKNPREIAKPWVDKAISKHWDAIMPTFVNVEKVGSAMSKLEYDERMAQIEREIEHVAHHYRMHVDR